jgi:putative hydrolase of the HAD superfamily
MTMHIRFVFVDAVDTLFRVRGSVGTHYAAIAARHGMPARAAELDAAFRRAMASAPPALFPGVPVPEIAAHEHEWWRAVVARAMTPLDRAPAFAAFFAEVFAHFATTAAWELLPGAREALVQLHGEGRTLGLVSEMDGRVHAVLADFALAPLFDTVTLASHAHAPKRDGGLFAAALARAGADPRSAVHLGDGLETDVEGARRAGITPILFDPPGRTQAPGVRAIRAWRELPAAVREVERL